MNTPIVATYMDHDPHAIQHTANIREAVESLIKANVLGAPVVDANNKVMGFISEHDCMSDMLNGSFYHQAPKLVADVMFQNPMVVSPDTSILELAERMMNAKPKNYPVIDDGRLVGLISRSNVLKALLDNE